MNPWRTVKAGADMNIGAPENHADFSGVEFWHVEAQHRDSGAGGGTVTQCAVLER